MLSSSNILLELLQHVVGKLPGLLFQLRHGMIGRCEVKVLTHCVGDVDEEVIVSMADAEPYLEHQQWQFAHRCSGRMTKNT